MFKIVFDVISRSIVVYIPILFHTFEGIHKSSVLQYCCAGWGTSQGYIMYIKSKLLRL